MSIKQTMHPIMKMIMTETSKRVLRNLGMRTIVEVKLDHDGIILNCLHLSYAIDQFFF